MSKTIVFSFMLLCAAIIAAEELSYPHEDREPAWQVQFDDQQARVLQHLRQKAEVNDGLAAEQVSLQAANNQTQVTLIHPISSSRLIEDLSAQLAFRSLRATATISFRVRLPHQKDPQSEGSLTFLVPGETSQTVDRWEVLHCQLLRNPTEHALQLARGRLRLPELNTKDMYVDAVVCQLVLPVGQSSVWLDELKVSGHIRAEDVVQPGLVQMKQQPHKAFPVRMELDRLYVNDRPRFPVIVPHHGESIGVLSQLGVNTVWIPDSSDQRLADSLLSAGMLTMATPPRPTNERGESLVAREGSLAPFGQSSESIMFWYLGTNIPQAASAELVSWQSQVSEADRQYHRPIMADVSDREDYFSHYLDMVGTSRPLPFTGLSYRDYRDWLIAKHRRSPGSFFWTWIDLDAGLGSQDYLEPEQLRLQVYAALSAGCRGLGYYTRQALDDDDKGNTELRLMMAELNREIQLLEPLLSTGTLVRTIPVQIGVDSETTNSSRKQSQVSRQRLMPEPFTQSQSDLHDRSQGHQVEAAVIRSDAGLLLLPVWYDTQAGTVPGQMAANKATIIVPGVSESAAAFQITPTGINNLDRQRDTGGMKIELSSENGMAFRETSAILVTSDIELVRRLQAKTREMARGSAMDLVLMAKSKWERVSRVDAELVALSHPQESATQILERSQHLIQQGEKEIERGQYSFARYLASLSMQLLRILQRQHWEEAASVLPHPATSPYAVSFQSLPAHWKLVKRVGQRSEYEVLSQLTSGNFEDAKQMIQDGWQHQQIEVKGVRSAAELFPTSHPGSDGQYSLRLATVPEDVEAPPVLVSKTVQVATPPVNVRGGDIVYVSGWVRVRFPANDRLDHALIFDSIRRPVGQIRFDFNQDWQRFELLREVHQSGPFQVFFALEGLGEMQIDDVQVVTLQSRSIPDPGITNQGSPVEPSFGDRARDLFNRLPSIPTIPGFDQKSERREE
jgi:hypothetical protein